jgi:1,2-diacylglycerol 3-beta-galactosyltransferase
MKELVIDYGIQPEKISVTGIPVKPIFALENRTKRQLRIDMGWDPDKTAILAMGSKRVSNLMGYLRAINHSGFELQLILVAGGDEALYKQFIAEDWHIPVKIENFANDIPSKLMACDMVISKAGGLITSESLAAGAPMLIVDVIPGQEEGNAIYVQTNQTGAIVNDPIMMLETIAHWLMDDAAELKRITENVKRIGKPRSSLEVADVIASCLR